MSGSLLTVQILSSTCLSNNCLSVFGSLSNFLAKSKNKHVFHFSVKLINILAFCMQSILTFFKFDSICESTIAFWIAFWAGPKIIFREIIDHLSLTWSDLQMIPSKRSSELLEVTLPLLSHPPDKTYCHCS